MKRTLFALVLIGASFSMLPTTTAIGDCEGPQLDPLGPSCGINHLLGCTIPIRVPDTHDINDCELAAVGVDIYCERSIIGICIEGQPDPR